MGGDEGSGSLGSWELFRAMLALRDNNAGVIAKRLYAMANPDRARGKVARYFREYEAATPEILACELIMPMGTVYGALTEFKRLGLVHKSYAIDVGVAGSKAWMFVIPDANESKVAEAHKFHLELRDTSTGDFMENPVRLLVAPIVDDVMTRIMKYKSKSDWQVPMWEVKDRFREEHGVVPPGFESVVHGLAKEKGWSIVVKG